MRKIFKFPLVSMTLLPTIGVPIITIACSGADVQNFKLLPTYTGQADQLIALGIKPDYYPLQLDASQPFDYLTNPSKYMKLQSTSFQNAFAKRLAELVPTSQGPSWWNQQALEDGEHGSDPEYWTHIGGALTLYENFLLDDGLKTIDSSTAPKHISSPYTFIRTNFRTSRDPYSRIPKNIINALLDQADFNLLSAPHQAVVKQMLDVARAIEGTSTVIGVDGLPSPSGQPTREATESESWLYNDYRFARDWHFNFLHQSSNFAQSNFANWLIEGSSWVFDGQSNYDQALAKLFFASTFQSSEDALKQIAYQQYFSDHSSSAPKSISQETLLLGAQFHHPIYEEQDEIGGAPMFEGAMRDNLLYLYDLAAKIAKATSQENQSINDPNYKYLVATFANDARWNLLQNALVNANKIASDLNTRFAKIKALVDSLNNPTFGIVTLAPGRGVSTIQSTSKYSFIYKELGFKAPLPSTLLEMANTLDVSVPSATNQNALFNMDDNGWWWNISDKNLLISSNRTSLFDKFDLGVLTANPIQYNNLKNDERTTLKSLWKGGEQSDFNLDRVVADYNIWNEGLKTPFVLHMLCDEILVMLKSRYNLDSNNQLWQEALSWGNYFQNEFISSH